MTPKELDFLYQMIERVSREVYRLGYDDGRAGKPLKEEGFKLSKASRLTIKTNLIKHTQSR